MNKLYAWILGMTKVGKVVKQVQTFFDGKKQIIIGLGTAIPPTILIIQNFTEQGLPYLMGIGHTPELAAAGLGWGLVFNALKGEKIRAENAEIITKLDANTAITQHIANKQ